MTTPKAVSEFMKEFDIENETEMRWWVRSQCEFYEKLPKKHVSEEAWVAFKMTAPLAAGRAAIKWTDKIIPRGAERISIPKEQSQ